MSDYTPSTGGVRRRYAYARSAGNKNQSAVAEFDRWLAAHDAEVREHARHEFCDPRLGCVVAEEPEWESESIQYGHLLAEGLFIVEHRGKNYSTHQRRIKLGRPTSSWAPVEQKGTDQ